MGNLKRCMCLMGVVLAARAASADGPPPFPHPLITEILYAVPSGDRGDANADGVRDAVGDEFIELVNPHDKPIQLKGYVIVDSAGWAPGAAKQGTPGGKTDSKSADGSADGAAKPSADKSGKDKDKMHGEIRFVFPELELKPGEVVVVFNGYQQKMEGEVGDSTKVAKKNEKFHGAYVFTMKNENPYAALGNEGDFVVVMDASEKPVQVVKWGGTAGGGKNPPKEALVTEEAPASIGSVQRNGSSGKLVAHKSLPGELAGTLFSPGVFALKASAETPKPAASGGGGGNRPNSGGKPKK
jgi:hypothetical protein